MDKGEAAAGAPGRRKAKAKGERRKAVAAEY
jgi:hypothetical protein